MRRIDTETADADLFGAGKDGFVDGAAPGTGSTRLNAAWFNAVQEELATAIEGGGGGLPCSDNALLKTLRLFSLLQVFADGSDVSLGSGVGGTIRSFTAGPVSFNSGRIVAVGAVGEIQTSPEGGVTWTHRTPAASYADVFYGVTNNETSLYVAVGANGEIQTSPDGTTWTHRTAAASYADAFQAVAWGASKFVAVGELGAIQSSPDGTTWTSRTAGSSYSSAFNAITFAAGLFVAVGESGEIQTSPDGVTWTRRRTGGGTVGHWRHVAYGNGIFVAASHLRYAATSPDGITWTDSASDVLFGTGPLMYVGSGVWLAFGPPVTGLSIDPLHGWVSAGIGLANPDAAIIVGFGGFASYGYQLIASTDDPALRITQRFVA